jgi:hypothetical protein
VEFKQLIILQLLVVFIYKKRLSCTLTIKHNTIHNRMEDDNELGMGLFDGNQKIKF